MILLSSLNDSYDWIKQIPAFHSDVSGIRDDYIFAAYFRATIITRSSAKSLLPAPNPG